MRLLARFLMVITFLVLPLIGRAGEGFDKRLFDAYQKQDMSVWKEYLNSEALHSPNRSSAALHSLLYHYGYCGYIVAEAKKEGKEALLPEAKACVQRFKSLVEQLHSLPFREGSGLGLPAGHYEMYLSAVYVFELRLHLSIHPLKAMSLAKEATRLAPDDPLVLSYYGTCLFYAPKPFGSKEEALTWFEKAEPLFRDPQWDYCWVKEANAMYIRQCHEKLNR